MSCPTPPTFEIALVDTEPDHSRLRFTGTIDATARDAMQHWTHVLRDTTRGNVTIDCAQLRIIDAAGSRLLGDLVMTLAGQHRTIGLRHLRPAIRQLLERSGTLSEWTTVLIRMSAKSG